MPVPPTPIDYAALGTLLNGVFTSLGILVAAIALAYSQVTKANSESAVLRCESLERSQQEAKVTAADLKVASDARVQALEDSLHDMRDQLHAGAEREGAAAKSNSELHEQLNNETKARQADGLEKNAVIVALQKSDAEKSSMILALQAKIEQLTTEISGLKSQLALALANQKNGGNGESKP